MKEEFIELLKSTNREGIENLLNFLEKSDFYKAPASTRFHGNYEGGLLEHSLKVYEIYKEKIKPQIVSEDSTLPRPVYYDVVSDAMYVLKGQEMNEMISGLIREYIFIEVKNQYSSYEEAKFCVLSITQMICSRYGIENKNESIDCVNHFNGMDDKVIKSELQDMKRIFDSVNQRMEHGLYMKGKNNYRGHEER